MKLIKKVSQHRRDFVGIYECQSCKNSEKVGGCYDDTNFHTNVTPEMKCEKCGESTNSLKFEQPLVSTRYSQHEVV